MQCKHLHYYMYIFVLIDSIACNIYAHVQGTGNRDLLSSHIIRMRCSANSKKIGVGRAPPPDRQMLMLRTCPRTWPRPTTIQFQCFVLLALCLCFPWIPILPFTRQIKMAPCNSFFLFLLLSTTQLFSSLGAQSRQRGACGDFVNFKICWLSPSKVLIGVGFAYVCSQG